MFVWPQANLRFGFVLLFGDELATGDFPGDDLAVRVKGQLDLDGLKATFAAHQGLAHEIGPTLPALAVQGAQVVAQVDARPERLTALVTPHVKPQGLHVPWGGREKRSHFLEEAHSFHLA